MATFDGEPQFGGLLWMLCHLRLVYGTSIIYDARSDLELSLTTARAAFTTSRVRAWLDHPGRQLMTKHELDEVRTARENRRPQTRTPARPEVW